MSYPSLIPSLSKQYNVFVDKKSLKLQKNQNPYIEEEQTTQWPKEKESCKGSYLKKQHIGR